MNTTLLSMTFAVLLGSTFVINGITVHTDDILKDAHTAVNGANLHQLATVIELYYSDHNEYPEVTGGEALVNLLEREEYIMNKPLDPNVFTYETRSGGQDYRLALNK